MSIIKIKRKRSGSAGPPGILYNGELAYNEVDDVLYYGKGLDTAFATPQSTKARSVIPIGGPGHFVDRKSDQTITGQKTFGLSPLVPTRPATDNSPAAASTAHVAAQFSTIVPGTYPKVTFNARGIILEGKELTAGDLPPIFSSNIVDFQDAVLSIAGSGISSLNPTSIADFANKVKAAVNDFYIDGKSGTTANSGNSSEFNIAVYEIVSTIVIDGATGNTPVAIDNTNFKTAVLSVVNNMIFDGAIGSALPTEEPSIVPLDYGGTGANLSNTPNGSIYKKSGNRFIVATPGVDYYRTDSTLDGGTY